MTDEIKQEKNDTPADFWNNQVLKAKNYWKDWRQTAENIEARYRAEKGFATGSWEDLAQRTKLRYNILYSNVQTLVPAIYSAEPKAQVMRRVKHQPNFDLDEMSQEQREQYVKIRKAQDLTEKTASMAVERTMNIMNESENGDIDKTAYNTVQELCLSGMGIARVTLDTETDTKVEQNVMLDVDPETGMAYEVIEEEKVEYITDQKSYVKFVHWSNFLCAPAPSWEDVRWVGFRHVMSKHSLKDSFPDRADDIPLILDVDGKSFKSKRSNKSEGGTHAEVWEIWDKQKEKRIYIAVNYDYVLKIDDDPLGVTGFFPVPEPMFANKTNDRIIPFADFLEYADQAAELDRLTSRISAVTEAMKVRFMYAKESGLAGLQSAGDATGVPVDNFEMLAQYGGINGLMSYVDIEPYAKILPVLYASRQETLDTIYQIIGLSDIIRGSATDPREAATTMMYKVKFANSRLGRRQADIQRFLRSLFRMQAEVISEHFDPSIIEKMTGIKLGESEVQLLRDDKMRSYRIDVDSDIMRQYEAQEEKQQRLEFLSAITTYLQQSIPLLEAGVPIDTLVDVLKFTIKGFNVGRNFEEMIDGVAENYKMKQQNQAQAQPTPEEQAKLTKAQADLIKANTGVMKEQREANKDQAEVALKANAQSIDEQELALKAYEQQTLQSGAF